MGSPALMDAQADQILGLLNATASWLFNHVTGGTLSDGGTTQASGANTAPNVDVDTTAIIDAVITGTATELAAVADGDADAGDQIVWGAVDSVEVFGVAVLSRGVDDDTPQVEVAFGAVATTAAGAALPTSDEIATALGHDNWSPIASFRLERTADTAITFDSIDHTARASVTAFPGDLSTTESDFASGGVARTFPVTQDPPPA